MSNRLHFSENLFIDNLELRKFQDFIFEEGWEEIIKNKIGSFGVVKNNKIDQGFNNFKISQGTSLNGEPTIVVNEGYCVGYDQNKNSIEIIKNEWTKPIVFPQNGQYYWVKIEPEINFIEKGVCSIDENGNLIGVGTEFTKVLRGQPNFPQVIRFYRLDKTDNYTKIQSGLNPLEYTVAQVIDDQNVILQGDFLNENSLYYEVVGTFTPGYIIPEEDKGIFRKNGCKISLVQENSPTTEPNKPNHVVDREFFIYRIKYENGQMKIEDFRNEIFKLDSEFDIEYVSNLPIPNIGLVRVEFSQGSTKENNNAIVEWGFFSNSYDVFPGMGKITILNGSGGKFKTSNDFQNGDFDGFRIYVLDYIKNELNDDYYSSFEKIYKILNSQKNGTAIDLLLENFSPLDFIPEYYSSGVNYTYGQKVSTTLGTHRLVVSSLSGISPVQPTYNNGTIYSTNQFVTFLNGTYRSLSNSNSGNTPDANPSFWELVWENYKSKIVIVPDCEEVIIHVKVGDDLTEIVDTADITDNCSCEVSGVQKVKNSYEQNQSYPAIFGRGVVPLIALNLEGGEKQDELVYNIQYRTKNNKIISSRKVLPSDSIGYMDELGNMIPYDTTLIDYAFIKSIRSKESYQDFKERIDLGDKLGWENIDNLEDTASTFAGRIIPIKVGVNKQRIIIKDSGILTSDIWFDLNLIDVKSGNEFEFYFEKFIDENQQYKINFIQGGLTGNILYSLSSELRQGNYIIRFKYDGDFSSWHPIGELNSFKGYNHFKPTILSNETSGFILLTSNPKNTELAPDGKRVIILEGDRNVISINDDAGYGEFAYVRFKNNIPITELYLSKHKDSSDIKISKDGLEAEDLEAITGNKKYFCFNSSEKHDTNGDFFSILENETVLHLILGKKEWASNSRQGYYLVSNSNDRSEIAKARKQPKVLSNTNNGLISPIPSGNVSSTEGFDHTAVTLPNDGEEYFITIWGSFIMFPTPGNTEKTYFTTEGSLKIDGVVVHKSSHKLYGPGGALDTIDDWAVTHNHFWVGEIKAEGQSIMIASKTDQQYSVSNTRLDYLLLPKED